MTYARHLPRPKPVLPNAAAQAGSFLLEALVAILVVALGVLGMVGLYSRSMQNVDESKIRGEAAFLATSLVGQMWALAGPSAGATANLNALFAGTGGVGGPQYLEFTNVVAQRFPNTAAIPPTVTVAPGPGTSTIVEITVQWLPPGETKDLTTMGKPRQVQFSAVISSNP